jgi:hypothetical protein
LSAELDATVALRHDLVRIIRTCLGLPETVAVPMAEHLARELCRSRVLTEWKSIPVAEQRAATHAAIRREFNGRNISELMRRYNVSRRTVYRVMKESGAEQTPKTSRSSKLCQTIKK